MPTRTHIHHEAFAATPDAVFEALITPSALRAFWGVATAIVLPEAGGSWAATWGGGEDAPDYVTVAKIHRYEPPHLLELTDYRYRAKSGPLPFAADFRTSFHVVPAEGGTTLEVRQTGFPAGPEADAFLAACEKGWLETFAGLRRYLEGVSR